jgi:hypothetical protein
MKNLRRLVYRFFERLIAITDRWLDQASAIKNLFLRECLVQLLSLLGDLSWLLRDIFSLPAYQARGELGRIVFIGQEGSQKHIMPLFFGQDETQWEPCGRFFTWNKGKAIRTLSADGVDLIILETSRILPVFKKMKYHFQTPVGIRQQINLPEKPEMLLSGKSMDFERRMINKAERLGYSYRFSKSLAEFDVFYSDVYLPFAKERFGNLALLDSYESMVKKFRQGGLLQVTKDGEMIASALCVLKGDTLYGTECGKKDTKKEDNVDLSLLYYWYTILWAYSQGVKKVDLGASPSWCANGIFRNKNRWKPTVSRFYPNHRTLQIYASDVSPLLFERLNKIKFITELRGDFCRVILTQKDTDTPATQEQQYVLEAQHDGLKGVLLLSPHSKELITADDL